MKLVAATLIVLAAGCAADDEADAVTGTLEVTQLDDRAFVGSLVTDTSVVTFESTSDDQELVALHLDINGAAMDFSYDVAGRLTEDGRGNRLTEEDLQALLDLRDAVNEAYPEVVESSLQGMFLSRHADWLADAPPNYEVETRAVLAAANTTHDDSIYNTCLCPGNWYTAYYDSGNSAGTQWQWTRQANSGSCLGRCGAGCNIFDTDLMLDCFEHDSCVDHLGGSVMGDNPSCGDEFSHAVDEYLVTYGAWCPC